MNRIIGLLFLCTTCGTFLGINRTYVYAKSELELNQKVQRFGDDLIKVIDSKASESEKISQVQKLVTDHNIINLDNMMRRTCGKIHYNELIKNDSAFKEKFFRYAVKIILSTIGACEAITFSIKNKIIRTGSKDILTAQITPRNNNVVVLKITMDPKTEIIDDIEVQGATSLIAMLRSQFKEVLDSRLRHVKNSAEKQNVYPNFIKEVSEK